jgi:hypothetical protein
MPNNKSNNQPFNTSYSIDAYWIQRIKAHLSNQ